MNAFSEREPPRARPEARSYEIQLLNRHHGARTSRDSYGNILGITAQNVTKLYPSVDQRIYIWKYQSIRRFTSQQNNGK